MFYFMWNIFIYIYKHSPIFLHYQLCLIVVGWALLKDTFLSVPSNIALLMASLNAVNICIIVICLYQQQRQQPATMTSRSLRLYKSTHCLHKLNKVLHFLIYYTAEAHTDSFLFIIQQTHTQKYSYYNTAETHTEIFILSYSRQKEINIHFCHTAHTHRHISLFVIYHKQRSILTTASTAYFHDKD